MIGNGDTQAASSRPAEPPKSTLEQVELLFHQALALPPPQRATLLQREAETRPAIAQEVAALLAADHALQQTAPQTTPVSRTAEPHATSAGAYSLLGVIGSGGAGIVYLAERTDAAPDDPQRWAAVKLLHGTLASGLAARQFLHERDALARLAHAGIARLLDAGTTPGGQPYVAMEYIAGQRIDSFADAPRTTAATLLPVVEQLCVALAEVHRNLILHRDIKPSNILVTAQGTAKLLDFGTQQLLDQTGAAPAGPHALSLRYSSPEQLENRPLSTASDVYSLGITLFRIFAGRLPALLEAHDVAAHLHALRHGTVEAPLQAAQTARLGLSRQLALDLNAIVAKSMAYHPHDRYSSVAAVLSDVRAARAGAQVHARGTTWTYRAALLWRHRRAELILGSLAALLLLAGVALSLRQERHARALQVSTQSGVRAEQHLAHFLLFDYFDQLHDQPGSIPAQRIAATEALRSLDELGQHSRDTALQLDAVEGYTRLGKLLGSPYEQDLGDTAAAWTTLERALHLAQQLRQQNTSDRAAQEAEESARTGLAQILVGQGKPKQAMPLILPAVATARAIAADSRSPATSLVRSAVTLNTFGDLYGQESDMSLHDGPLSIAVYREAEHVYAAGLQRDPACSACRGGIALQSWKLGMLHRNTDTVLAEADYTQALEAIQALPPAELAKSLARRRHIFIRQRLAEAEAALGRLAPAVQLDEAARADCQQITRNSPQDMQSRRDLADIDSQLSGMYLQTGQPQRALETAQEYLATEAEIARLAPTSAMWKQLRFDAESVVSQALRSAGRRAEADTMQTAAVADAIRFADAPDASDAVLNLAAITLTQAHAHPEKAVLYAERNMKDDSDPDGDELVELALAEAAVGNRDRTAAAIAAASSFLARNPRSPDHDRHLRQLRDLQHPSTALNTPLSHPRP